MLTIGIPTYNRKDAVVTRVKEILKLDLVRSLDLLVIDNGSVDGTFAALREIDLSNVPKQSVRFLTNDENLGFAGNFFKLFSECQTKFLLIISDEDRLEEKGVRELVNFASKNNPDFVSPRALLDQKVYRGRDRTIPMNFMDHESASFYISGLCYNVHSAVQFTPWLADLSSTNAMVEVYPQTALAGCLVATGRGFWLGSDVTHKADNLASHIRHNNGSEYFHIPGRYEQFRGSIELLDCLVTRSDVTREAQRMIIKYQARLRKGLFIRMRQALQTESHSLRREFDRGAINYYVFGFWRRAIVRLLSQVQVKPWIK